MRVGVVGLSHFHVTGWVETIEAFPAELEIVALYDPDPERGRALAPPHHDPTLRPSLGERYRGLPFETRLHDLIERHAIDVALVTLPNAEGPEAIAILAGAGVHMLIDKPAARSAAELRPAADRVSTAGVRVVVGLTRRYAPAAIAAREVVRSGRVGRLLSAEAVFATSSVAIRDPRNILFDRAASGGGILSWLGVHDIDALRWLSGEEIVAVSAMSGTGHNGLEVEDVISVGVRFAGGAIGTIHGSYSLPAPGYRGRLALRGVAGSIELAADDELVVLTQGPDGSLHEDRASFSRPPVAGYGAQGRAAVEDLLGRIADGAETAAPLDELVRDLAVIDAAYSSAATGRTVAVDDHIEERSTQ